MNFYYLLLIVTIATNHVSYKDTGEKNYNQVKEWIAVSFTDANKVIELDTPEKIIIKGNFVINYKYVTNFKRRVNFSMVILIKDSTYQATIQNMIVQNPVYPLDSYEKLNDPVSKKIVSACQVEAQLLLYSLKK